MPALSYFNAVTWFAPDNVVVSNLFGVRSGLGMLPITFDWAQISYIGSPLMTPAWAAANVVGGLVVVMWGIAPVLCKCSSFFVTEGEIFFMDAYSLLFLTLLLIAVYRRALLFDRRWDGR
jgi:hypothetical protein